MDICDFVLNKNRLIAIAFAAASSDLFKDDITLVYKLAEKTIIE